MNELTRVLCLSTDSIESKTISGGRLKTKLRLNGAKRESIPRCTCIPFVPLQASSQCNVSIVSETPGGGHETKLRLNWGEGVGQRRRFGWSLSSRNPPTPFHPLSHATPAFCRRRLQAEAPRPSKGWMGGGVGGGQRPTLPRITI